MRSVFGVSASVVIFIVALQIATLACSSSPDEVSPTAAVTTPSPTYKKGTFPVPVGPPNASVIANELLTPQPPGPVCGPWGAADGSVGSVIEALYGEERNCGFFDGYWVITTLGLIQPSGTRATGVIGIYPCQSGDNACLDGQSDHPLSGWSYISPPHPGGLTILGHPGPGQIIVDDGGYQLLFDIGSRTFS